MRKLLPTFKLSTHIKWLLYCTLATSVLLSGCSTSPKPPPFTATLPTSGTEKNWLKEAEKALASADYETAEKALQHLDHQPLAGTQKLLYLLFNTQLYLALQEPDLANLFLSELITLEGQANTRLLLQIRLTQALYLEATHQYLPAAERRNRLISQLHGHQGIQNQEQLWQDLMKVAESELHNSAGLSPNTQFGQWLQLANIVRNSHLTLEEQISQIQMWKNTHPYHPASIHLPAGLQQLTQAIAERPKKVAVLLPLTGRLATTGHAVRDGFMAAYYEALNKGSEVPTLQFYNSADYQDINQVYTQAQFDNAQWLVGPIEKPLVQQLQDKSSLPLPTLALNYGERTENKTPPAQLYQFGLAAEDEAVQIAEKAWADGKRNALVLVPDGQWGERIYEAFKQKWLTLGGDINKKIAYPNRQDYNPDIKSLLNIDDSQKRFSLMRLMFYEKVEFEPRRRQDADWIFMVALPQQARQIKPTLAFNFAADLPVYATSHIYSSEANPSKDRDLNGITYCDIPWLLTPNQLYTRIENSIANGQGSYARLYAMGVDTFRLLPQLKILEAAPNNHLFGSTGALQLDGERRVTRRSECTIFEHGRPKRLSRSE